MKWKSRSISRRIILLTMSVTGMCVSQKKTHSEIPRQFSVLDPRYSSVIVATVGQRKITAQEFLLNYEFGPAFPKREEGSKRRYLNFMLYEKLLALDGYARGLDHSPEAQHALAEVQADLATEELYKDDVLKYAHVTEPEIQRGMKQQSVSISVRWLYVRTPDERNRYSRLLANGSSFDSLYALQLKDSVKPEDRSMEETLFDLHRKNLSLAKIVDTLRPGEVSLPVQGPDGFYFIELRNKEIHPVITESDLNTSYSDVRRALVQSKADSLSDRYVDHLMKNNRPTIIRQSLDILQVYLANSILDSSKFREWKLEERLRERWNVTGLADSMASRSLVQLKDTVFRIQDFLWWYHAREENLRVANGTPEEMYSSIERMVWLMIRDKALSLEAFKRGLQKRGAVRQQSQWWKDKIVYKLVKQSLERSIRYTNDTLRAYFQEHQRDYRDSTGQLSFEKHKEDVLKDFFSYELTKRTLHKIIELKKKYTISIEDQALKNVPVDTEHDPRAIDVYAVKKGGIFPRPAFPSIDFEWQTWN